MTKLKFGFLNILILLLVFAIGIFAVLVFAKKNLDQKVPEATEILDGQVQKLNEVGNSDEISQIESELNTTNIGDLDQGVLEVDTSLKEL